MSPEGSTASDRPRRAGFGWLVVTGSPPARSSDWRPRVAQGPGCTSVRAGAVSRGGCRLKDRQHAERTCRGPRSGTARRAGAGGAKRRATPCGGAEGHLGVRKIRRQGSAFLQACESDGRSRCASTGTCRMARAKEANATPTPRAALGLSRRWASKELPASALPGSSGTTDLGPRSRPARWRAPDARQASGNGRKVRLELAR